VNYSKKPKVLYIFAGERRRVEELWKKGEGPDTSLIGFNYLKDFGIDAEYIETSLMNRLRKINYNLANLSLIFKIRQYDVLFSGSSLFLPFVSKVLFHFKKPKFVWYNTFFTNALKRNQKGLKSWAIRKAIGSLDAIVCPTKRQKEFLIKEGFDEKKIFCIPTSVDADFIEKKQNNTEPSAKKYILSVGKDNGRDYKTLIEAMRGLDEVNLIIVALPRNLKGINDIPSNVTIRYNVPFNELVGIYKNAKFIIITTKKEDHTDASDCSGHYVLLDSMVSGKAIIVSDRSTLREYFENGSDGIMVPPEDVVALRNAIKELYENPERQAQMGARAKNKIQEGFTTRKMAESLSDLFKNMLK